METSFGTYWTATREHLDAAFERSIAGFFEPLPPAHVAAVREVLAGGKRLRAGLVCLLNEALGGQAQAALAPALAVECVQSASLIHDDWVDGDTVRRDRAATWTTQGPRRAVLLGDLIFATALRRMAEVGQAQALALGEAIATMAAGAYQEPLQPADLDAIPHADAHRLYPRLIYLKTAMLFGTAARLGALAAGSPAPLAALAFDYGARIGEAYQMADDLADAVSEDAASTAAQLPVLLSALWHFRPGSRDQNALTPPHVDELRPQLREAMQAAIAARVRQATDVARQLPAGRHAALLRAAPAEIVRAMQAAPR